MKRLLLATTLLLLIAGTEESALAQNGNVGAGIQIGSPTGFTLRYDLPDGTSVDGAMAWHFNRKLVIQGHYLPIQGLLQTGGEADLHYFIGPGAFIATRGTDDDFDIGASSNFGLSYYHDVFEFFGQVTPQLAFIPATRFMMGLAVGVRYYF